MSGPDLVDAALSALPEGCVILRHCHTQNLRWANSTLTTNGDTLATDITVVATETHSDRYRMAVISGQVSNPQAAAEMARRAAGTCRQAPTVMGAPLLEGSAQPDFATAPDTITAETSGALISAVRTLLASPHRQFGYAEADWTTTYLASTTGIRYRHVQPAVRFEACARDETGSTWWGATRAEADMDTVVERQTADLAIQQRTEELPAGRHRVLLSPSALADLMIYLAWSAGGRDAVEGQNVFARPGGGTRLGERLTDRPISIFADPAYPGLRCADRAIIDVDGSMESVFDNGWELSRQNLISDGVLASLRASRPTAAEFGLPTVYLADNLILTDESGTGGEQDLISRTDDAVLITCLWYIREVDRENLLLTGLTRDGVYRVRDGRIVAGLPNFRFNVSVPEVLASIVDATRTVECLPREWADYFTRAAMPAVCVDGFNLSSVSEAW